MARRFKVAIVNDAREMNVYYITKKLRLGHNIFKPTRKSHELYIIDPKYSITTTTKRLGIPFRYTTFYYKRNVPKPIPMDQLHGGQSLGKKVVDESGQVLADVNGNELIEITHPMQMPSFDNWDYNSISSEELDKLLDPNFVSMVARANKKQNEQLMFYLQVGTALGIAFIVYYMMQTLPGNIAAKVAEFLAPVIGGK